MRVFLRSAPCSALNPPSGCLNAIHDRASLTSMMIRSKWRCVARLLQSIQPIRTPLSRCGQSLSSMSLKDRTVDGVILNNQRCVFWGLCHSGLSLAMSGPDAAVSANGFCACQRGYAECENVLPLATIVDCTDQLTMPINRATLREIDNPSPSPRVWRPFGIVPVRRKSSNTSSNRSSADPSDQCQRR